MLQTELTAAMESAEEEGGELGKGGRVPFFGAASQKQRKRVAQCTLDLAQKLQPLEGYTDGGELDAALSGSRGPSLDSRSLLGRGGVGPEVFGGWLANDIAELNGSPFGSMLLATIGQVCPTNQHS